METESPKRAPILEIAWERYAELSLGADKRTRTFFKVRRWIAWIGVLATLFAIVIHEFFEDATSLEAWIAIIPVVISMLAAFSPQINSNREGLIYRAGAEEIKKEIYLYRTILPKDKTRRDYLAKRLQDIQRRLFRSLGDEFAFEGYRGLIPPHYHETDPNSDPGFHDLTGDEYVKYRLKNLLDWYIRRLQQRKYERQLMNVLLVAVIGVGVLLAVLGGSLSLWIAFVSSVAAALLGWQELRKGDEIIRGYSKLVRELTILHDHWLHLEAEERTAQELEKIVLSCERLLWEENREYVRSMQEALRETDLGHDAGLINQIIKESASSVERAREKMHENIIEIQQGFLGEMEQKFDQTAGAALGSLAEEASSEIVQRELEAMGQASSEKAEDRKDDYSSFVSSIAQIKKDYAHMEISKDTPIEVLNNILAKYPKTNEVKG